MSDQAFPGLIFAVNLDGKGGCSPIPDAEVKRELKDTSLSWVHLDYSAEGIEAWLRDVAELDEVTVAALTADEPRPRCIPHQDGLIVILRGVNLNPGEDREDMVSIRLWINHTSVISMRQRRLMSPTLVKASLDAGSGPCDQGELIVALSSQLCDFIAEVINDLETEADALEESVMTLESHQLRGQLSNIRREAIALRRYLSPQREALAALMMMRQNWLNDLIRIQMREIADRTVRYIEDLDAVRERAAVTHEELSSRISERMNRIMYFFSMITGIFLPLGLLTGLLGINVGGMPGANHPQAFWMVCGLLVLLAVFQIWLFKKMKWL